MVRKGQIRQMEDASTGRYPLFQRQHPPHQTQELPTSGNPNCDYGTEVCDLPVQGCWETVFHHPMADGEAAGMIDLRLGLKEDS